MKINNFSFRLMLEADLDVILVIERCCYPHPWSENQFLQELENPLSQIKLLCCDDEVCGYLCYWLIADEMEIQNIATAPAWRRRGVAGLLLAHAFSEYRDQGGRFVWLEVRETNTAAIELYLRHGFEVRGERKEYYRDGENALLMRRDFAGL